MKTLLPHLTVLVLSLQPQMDKYTYRTKQRIARNGHIEWCQVLTIRSMLQTTVGLETLLYQMGYLKTLRTVPLQQSLKYQTFALMLQET